MADRVVAYVLIQTTMNAASVAHEIRDIEGVEQADDVSGPYDVFERRPATWTASAS